MLIYLAEKTGLFLPASGAQRYHVLKWASFQATHAPYLGSAHWYRLLSPEAEPYSINRFIGEARRIYTLLDEELATRPYFAGADYSIADISFFPWIEYHGWQGQDMADYPHLSAWFDRVGARPAVQRGRCIPYPQTEYGDSPESRAAQARIEALMADPARFPTRADLHSLHLLRSAPHRAQATARAHPARSAAPPGHHIRRT